MTAPTNDQIRDAWNGLAEGFDDFVTPLTIRFGEEALQRLDLRPGMRVLDVAAGSGALAIPAARLGAEVLAADIAPTMVERLRRRADAEGLPLESAVMDGESLDLEEGTFDLSMSLNGVSLFPDFARGLGEMVRVTKPGGRVLVAAFMPPPKTEFIGLFVGALRATIPGFAGLPTDPPPLPFQVSDPPVMRGRLGDGGLTEVEVETITLDMEIASAEYYWRAFVNSNPIGAMLVADLDDAQQDEVRQVLDRMLRERSGGTRSAVLSNEVIVGIGRR